MVKRIHVLLVAISLLSIPATGMLARAASPDDNGSAAVEALKASVPLSSFDAAPPVPEPSGRAAGKLSGEELFQSLHDSLNGRGVNIKSVPGYKQAKAYMYSKADNTGCDGGPGIITFYSEVCARGSSANGDDYHEQGDQNDDGVVDKIVNAEHIWPQSYFNSALPMVADIHQLASTFETPNGRRANLRFARVSNAVYSTSCGSKLGSEGFEPCDPEKGNVARAMLYFVVRYYDKSIRQGMDYNSFWTSRVPMLLEWNRQDPPDANEQRRNGLVETFQGNRNPFIDDPSLADQIGAKVFQSH
ncbi:MAG: endonuclease [Elusimicrobia bacterium]|nr:endonuclease [Elusimicrobiota bacterium]